MTPYDLHQALPPLTVKLAGRPLVLSMLPADDVQFKCAA